MNPINATDESGPTYRDRGDSDRPQVAAYYIIAIVALVVGMMIGSLGRGTSGGSRIDWPKPSVPHPRSISP